MANCPKCNADMDAFAVKCTECDFAFPKQNDDAPQKSGFIYSKFADLILILTICLYAIGLIGIIIGSFIHLAKGNINEFLAGLTLTFFAVSVIIVVKRVLDLSHNNERP